MAESLKTTSTGLRVARSELILGGQRSGKSRHAELLAREWLAQSPQHQALMLATGQAYDEEMRERIRRHQADRAERVPGMLTLETPVALPAAIEAHSHVHTLLVVDCLTLWLTQLLMPYQPSPGPGHGWGDANDPRFQPPAAALPSLDDPQDPATLVHALQRARGRYHFACLRRAVAAWWLPRAACGSPGRQPQLSRQPGGPCGSRATSLGRMWRDDGAV